MRSKRNENSENVNTSKFPLVHLVTALAVTFFLFGFATPVNNTTTKFKAASASSITVEGTSSMHDWEMTSENVSSSAEFIFDDDGNQLKIKDVSFSVKVKSLKSGKSKLDNNAYEKLKADQYPTVSFRSNAVKTITGNSGKVRMPGKLTVAGVSKSETVDLNFTRVNKGKWKCTGQTKLLMTDFDIEPPSFMGGMMKTGDEVVVNYEIIFIQ